MENSKNVQLHEIIKNSLATYLSYKWSQNKLYLKKRKKKSRSDDGDRKKKLTDLERQHSIINLENDVFIYDAKTKTFTQLDLCDCFKNGLKYRRSDPFDTKPKKKKNYKLCEIPVSQDDIEGVHEYQNYQLVHVEDSVEHVFSKDLVKRDHWGKAINTLCPSKFDLFIQKELNKCTGRNFNVKSFRINASQECETPANGNVCSAAEIGYYTITTYDNAIQCDTPSHLRGIEYKGPVSKPQKQSSGKTSSKRSNLNGIREESVNPKKMYSKALQCKRSNQNQPAASKKEKDSSTNETGIQCFYAPLQHAEQKTKIEPLDPKITEILLQSRKSPPPRQKLHGHMKPLRKKHSSLSDLFTPADCKTVRNIMQINSSAEIRKIMNENPSTSSFSLSNTGDYFRTFLSPRPLRTYYQTSSTSKDNKYDTNDDQYSIKAPIIVAAAASNPISPICSGPCATKKQKKACTCTETNDDSTNKKDKEATTGSCCACSNKAVGLEKAQRSVSGPKLKSKDRGRNYSIRL